MPSTWRRRRPSSATCCRPTPRSASSGSRRPTAPLLLERLGSQESVAVLRHLPTEHREAVLSSLGPQWLMAFKLLLSYPTEHRRRVGRAARADVARRLHGRRGARPHRAQRARHASAHLRARPLAAPARRRARPRAAAGVEPQEARVDPRAGRRALGARRRSRRRKSTASGSATRKRPSSIATRSSSA